MSASDYLDEYQSMSVVLASGTPPVQLPLQRYVTGTGGAPWAAREPLIAALIQETSTKAKPTNWGTPEFQVGTPPDQRTIRMAEIVGVFCGKGSPKQIQNVLWLAYRYGFILNPAKKRAGAMAALAYCNAFIGLDCNGFTGNYIGIDPSTDISSYDHDGKQSYRRKSAKDIDADDLIITYKLKLDDNEKSHYKHIAVVDKINSVTDAVLDLNIVEWGESGQVHHYVPGKKWTCKTDEKGYVYHPVDDNTRRYFCEPMQEVDSNE